MNEEQEFLEAARPHADTCEVDDCGKPVTKRRKGKSYCSAHYEEDVRKFLRAVLTGKIVLPKPQKPGTIQ